MFTHMYSSLLFFFLYSRYIHQPSLWLILSFHSLIMMKFSLLMNISIFSHPKIPKVLLRGARITTYICTLLDGFVVPYDNCSFFQEGELQQLYYEVPQCCSTFVDFQFEKQSHNSRAWKVGF